jgi:ABC-type Fe3+-siderophore transport system permease subunit
VTRRPAKPHLWQRLRCRLGACTSSPVAADWLGRTLIFPWQVPAGLLAAFVGGPYFMALMWKRGSR